MKHFEICGSSLNTQTRKETCSFRSWNLLATSKNLELQRSRRNSGDQFQGSSNETCYLEISSLHLLSRSVFAGFFSHHKSHKPYKFCWQKDPWSALAVWIFPCLSARPRTPIEILWNTTSRTRGTHVSVTPSVIHCHRVPAPFSPKRRDDLSTSHARSFSPAPR